MLETIMREKMKKEKEIEVPLRPRGKQDNEHVIMCYTIRLKSRGKFRAEPERKKEREMERDYTLGGEGRHIN